MELLRLVLAVQQKIMEPNGSLPLPHLCAIHAVLATVMSIIVPISPLRESLLSHVQSVSYFIFSPLQSLDSSTSHFRPVPLISSRLHPCEALPKKICLISFCHCCPCQHQLMARHNCVFPCLFCTGLFSFYLFSVHVCVIIFVCLH